MQAQHEMLLPAGPTEGSSLAARPVLVAARHPLSSGACLACAAAGSSRVTQQLLRLAMQEWH